MKTLHIIGLAIGIPVMLVVGCAISCGALVATGQHAQEEAKDAEIAKYRALPVINITSAALFDAYHENEVTADAAYKNHPLCVQGVVTSIRKDFTDEIIIGLSTSNQFENVDAHGISQSVASSLSKGTTALFCCRGNGMIIGSPQLVNCAGR